MAPETPDPAPANSQPGLWRGQLIGDYYANHVVGGSRQVVDGVQLAPLLNAPAQPWTGGGAGETNGDSFVEKHRVSAWFTADEDAAPGAQPTMVSRSGSPRWSESFFGVPGLSLLQSSAGQAGQSYKSERYGGSLAGPIRKTGAQFFIEYLGLRQSVLRSVQGFVPAPAFRRQVLASEPALAPILDAYPAITRPLGSADNTVMVNTLGKQTFAEDLALVRVDRSPLSRNGARKDSAFVRFSMAFAQSQAPLSGVEGFLRDTTTIHSRPYSLVGGWSRPLDARIVNGLHVAYLREELDSINRGALSSPYTVVIPSLTALNGNQSSFAIADTFSVSDQATRTFGRHAVQAGVEVRRVDLDVHLSDSGRVTFSSLTAFAGNEVNWATYNQAVPHNVLVDWQEYGWIQDNWKLRPNLLLGAGVRYEFYGRTGNGKAVPFDFSTCGRGGFCPAGAAFNQYNPLNLDPRVSVAWAPNLGPFWIRRNVVLRAGGAIYHSNGLLIDQSQPVYNEVQSFYLNAALDPDLRYPIPRDIQVDQSGIESPHGMSRRRPNPYANEWSVSAQSQLPSRVLLTTTWFAASGAHLPTATYINLIQPASQARPHPAFGQIRFLDNTSSSNLNILAVTATRSLPKGAQIMGGYNWSHEIDNDAAGDMASDAPQNPACARCERSSGDLDIRHLGGVRTVFPLPVAGADSHQGSAHMFHLLTERWILLNDFYATSALPVNVTIDRPVASVATGYTIRQRPDRVLGVSLRPSGGSSVNQWINPAAFTTVHGLYGTAGRNIARGPGMWTLSSGLDRELLLPKDIHVHLMMRGQNIFNHANYAQPFADWSTPQFGQIITPYAPSRVGDAGPRSFLLDLSFSR